MAIPPCPQITTSTFVKNGASCGQVSGIIHAESFEGPVNIGYSSSGVFTDGVNDYFDLIGDGADPTGLPGGGYTGADGLLYWAGEDTEDPGNPNISGISSLSINGINISGASSIQMGGLFASGTSLVFDDADFIQIYAQIDGGGFILIGAFEGLGGFNTTLNQDTNLDGVGDGIALNTTFQNISFPIAGLGSILDIRVDVYMTSDLEAIAIDNVVVSGLIPDTCQACPNDTLSFTVTGTNLPLGGNIDWYFDTTAGFSPYIGDGTYIGSSPIPYPIICTSPTLYW